MTKKKIIVMCSISFLISFKSTERSGTKLFFIYGLYYYQYGPKNMLQTFFFTFFSYYIWHYFCNYQLLSRAKRSDPYFNPQLFSMVYPVSRNFS